MLHLEKQQQIYQNLIDPGLYDTVIWTPLL